MDELYFSVELDDERTLCLAPLTDRRLSMSGQEINDPSGYFLYEQRGSGEFATVEIIAQIISDEALLRIRDAFNMR